ncbi:MAG: nucleotidyltransferase family protein [Pseudomonadota bacterium]
MTHFTDTNALIHADPLRMACLQALYQLDCPDALIAAGFVRNLIWDESHGYDSRTPLNDVDVVYFDAADTSLAAEQVLADKLAQAVPALPWQVRNQARMHLRNGHAPYRDSADAISYFPEIETCVGVRLDRHGAIEIVAPYGLAANWQLSVSENPKPGYSGVFDDRIKAKAWLQRWPQLVVQRLTPGLVQAAS